MYACVNILSLSMTDMSERDNFAALSEELGDTARELVVLADTLGAYKDAVNATAREMATLQHAAQDAQRHAQQRKCATPF